MQWPKVTNSVGKLSSQTWQTEWKTASLAKVQLYKYENQTLEAFGAASRLYSLLLATAHGNWLIIPMDLLSVRKWDSVAGIS